MIGIKGIAKKPIIDATASSEDVISGKIFYNNSGKSEGTMSKDLCYKQFGISIPKGKYNSYNEVTAYSLQSNVGSSSNIYFPNGINVVRYCNRQDNGRGYSYQKISDYSVDVNVDLSTVAYFIINGTKFIFSSNMTVNTYYGHEFVSSTQYYYFNNFLLYMDNDILKTVYAGTEYTDYGNLKNDVTLYIVYHS